MSRQRIILGDCLDVLGGLTGQGAVVSDPPANIGFMGRDWDKAHPATDFILPRAPRSKKHERELRQEEAFIRYWTERFAMAYDVCDQHAVSFTWTLPRTSYQTAAALRRAGWEIKDEIKHLFGTGMAKSGNALAPGYEGWLLATKGSPDINRDACRVPRGSDNKSKRTNTAFGRMNDDGWVPTPMLTGGDARGSLPKNVVLSHCEECEPCGEKTVQPSGGNARSPNPRINSIYGSMPHRPDWTRYGDDGGEVIRTFRCLAGCECGAQAVWPDTDPLPACPCGRTWGWLCPVAELNRQSGPLHAAGNLGAIKNGANRVYSPRGTSEFIPFKDKGGASRFFNTLTYISKASPSERHAGCQHLFWRANRDNPFGFDRISEDEWKSAEAHPLEGKSGRRNNAQINREHRTNQRARGNVHPTVKSLALMRLLHRLTGASSVIDLCAGSGSGMAAAAIDGIQWTGAEIHPEAVEIAEARHLYWAGVNAAMESFSE